MATNAAPIRRRRCLIFTIILLGVLFFFFVPWELPAGIREVGMSGLSRANIAQLVKPKIPPAPTVDEIYGLLHLVTGNAENEHILSSPADLDLTEPLDWDVYAAGESIDWNKEAKMINKRYPIIMFSKTYCQFSQRAKTLLLDTYKLTPPPKIIEVDLRDDSYAIKVLLTRMTKRSTFPNILVNGKSIGGADEVLALHFDRGLTKVLVDAGITVKFEDE